LKRVRKEYLVERRVLEDDDRLREAELSHDTERSWRVIGWPRLFWIRLL
jgi:hypothetical protein